MKHVAVIACGGNHSGCIAGDGKVYTWGSDLFGQLGVHIARSYCTTQHAVLRNRVVSVSLSVCQLGVPVARLGCQASK